LVLARASAGLSPTSQGKSICAFSSYRLYVYVSPLWAVSGFCLFCSIAHNDPPD